jgi:alpha-L-arabinofuranosidase
MADALAVATYLNIFIRNCSWVQMANLAQLVNAIAPVVTTPEVAVVQPIYFPLLMHSQTALDLAVDVHVDGPTVAAPDPPPVGRWAHRLGDLGPFYIVDASATVDAQPVANHRQPQLRRSRGRGDRTARPGICWRRPGEVPNGRR